MLASTVLQTVAKLHRDGLPAPVHYRVGTTSVHLEFDSRIAVDRWAAHIGMPPPWDTSREYGSCEFWAPEVRPDHNADTGWCGATVVTVSMSTPVVAA